MPGVAVPNAVPVADAAGGHDAPAAQPPAPANQNERVPLCERDWSARDANKVTRNDILDVVRSGGLALPRVADPNEPNKVRNMRLASYYTNIDLNI